MKKFEKVIKRKRHVQASTTYHNTLCSVPGCYSNCHKLCRINFTRDPSRLTRCSAMDKRGVKCKECGHKTSYHRHYDSVWKVVEEDKRVVDKKAEKKHREAMDEKDRADAMKRRAQKAIDELTRDVADALTKLERLAKEYANLAQSGSLSGEAEKTIALMEYNIATMRKYGADSEMIKKLEKCVSIMGRSCTP